MWQSAPRRARAPLWSLPSGSARARGARPPARTRPPAAARRPPPHNSSAVEVRDERGKREVWSVRRACMISRSETIALHYALHLSTGSVGAEPTCWRSCGAPTLEVGEIADRYATGSSARRGVAVGDLPACSVSAPQLVPRTLGSGRTPPLYCLFISPRISPLVMCSI